MIFCLESKTLVHIGYVPFKHTRGIPETSTYHNCPPKFGRTRAKEQETFVSQSIT